MNGLSTPMKEALRAYLYAETLLVNAEKVGDDNGVMEGEARVDDARMRVRELLGRK